jgi:PAS domain S-box-containing protein
MDIYQRIFESTPDALLVVDHHGLIRRLNAQAERLFGYERTELLDQPVEMLVPRRFGKTHAATRDGYLAEPRTRPMGAGLDLFGRRRDEEEFPVDIMLGPIESSAEGTLVLCVVRDVSERRAAENRIRESLREKEVLLKEIHHRVKNNLALISSMFYLQSGYTSDEAVIKILQEGQDRVRSMALVHETLYGSENLADVDFSQYAVTLAQQLIGTYALEPDAVSLVTEMDPCRINIDLAVPLGLILNELVTNALKHGFPPGRRGEIQLRLALGDLCVLRVIDTGVGVPPGVDIHDRKSLGLRLIHALCRQIDARFDLVSGPRTEAIVTRPKIEANA